MVNLQMSARQIMMMCQQLKMASAQNDTAMEDNIIEQLKSLADDIVTNDDSWSRFVPYVTAIKAIYDVYEKRSDLYSCCELAIESLMEMTPLTRYINQEKPASMLTLHLDLALYPMYQMHGIMASQNIEHDISPITLLADLLKDNVHNLSQINPSNPLVNGLYRHVCELDNAGLTGTCGDMDLQLYPCIVLLNDFWKEAKSKYQTYSNSRNTTIDDIVNMELLRKLMSFSNSGRFGISDSKELDEKTIDMILQPIYENVQEAIDYDKLLSDFDNLESISNGFSFARAFYNFTYYYTEFCNYRGITPFNLSTLYIDDAVPYCSSLRVVQLHDEAKRCFISLADTLGLSKDELIEKLENDDAMLDMAVISDEHLQPLIISMVETNIEAEGVILANRGMALKALNFEDNAIADDVNNFVNILSQHKFLKEIPSRFTEQYIHSVFQGIHIN